MIYRAYSSHSKNVRTCVILTSHSVKLRPDSTREWRQNPAPDLNRARFAFCLRFNFLKHFKRLRDTHRVTRNSYQSLPDDGIRSNGKRILLSERASPKKGYRRSQSLTRSVGLDVQYNSLCTSVFVFIVRHDDHSGTVAFCQEIKKNDRVESKVRGTVLGSFFGSESNAYLSWRWFFMCFEKSSFTRCYYRKV